MHDFCLTIPYGLILFLGGGVGYIHAGSFDSLFAGAGLGLTLMALGKLSWNNYLSLNAAHEIDREEVVCSSNVYVAMSMMISIILTVVMGHRYVESEKFMPAGGVAGLSLCMTLFYLYKIITFKEHKYTKVK